MDENKKPFYADGDRVAELASTIVVLGIAIVFFAGCVWVVTKMF